MQRRGGRDAGDPGELHLVVWGCQEVAVLTLEQGRTRRLTHLPMAADLFQPQKWRMFAIVAGDHVISYFH